MHATLAAATLSLTALLGAGSAVAAQDVDAIGKAFADHCFSPYLTAAKAKANIGPSGARIEFYDLRPFSSAPPSPVTGRAVTEGTDRRCEVSFDGFAPAKAVEWIAVGVKNEGLSQRKAEVPDNFVAQDGMSFIAAAQLNPNRIAVVQAGVRNGPNGDETFLSVERLLPLDEVSQ